jgi:hypothetical protein
LQAWPWGAASAQPWGAASAVLLAFQYATRSFASSAIFLGLWIVAPALMRWLAHPEIPTARRNLNHADTAYLRMLARRTWRYFDDLVGPESNWLPPDNQQLALRIEVAQRTSPTNIGLWLTSALAATDLGYLSADQFLERAGNTLATLGKLERYEGHLLNWYDTRTLQPLLPRYVSTVDSGNLLATLWVLNQGCGQLQHRPVVGHACLRGLEDTLAILRETYGSDPSIAAAVEELGHLVEQAYARARADQPAAGKFAGPRPDPGSPRAGMSRPMSNAYSSLARGRRRVRILAAVLTALLALDADSWFEILGKDSFSSSLGAGGGRQQRDRQGRPRNSIPAGAGRRRLPGIANRARLARPAGSGG